MASNITSAAGKFNFLVLTLLGIFVLSTIVLSAVLFSNQSINQSINNRSTNLQNGPTAIENDPYRARLQQDNELAALIRNKFLNAFDPQQMVDDLREISKTVHTAGTKENENVRDLIIGRYKELGLDTKTYEYEVLLSYPNFTDPNTFSIWNASEADWSELSDGLGQRLGPDEAISQMNSSRTTNWWNGYSKNAVATGQLVYANYGTYEDYQQLDRLNISIAGKLVICRYAFVWRGAKVFEAEQRNASGVILYMDPYDYRGEGGAKYDFPNGLYMPAEGAQRGTLKRNGGGDPQTPFYPSKPYAYRPLNESSLRAQMKLPNIPVMPMGYRDAVKILGSMDGPPAPDRWVGGLPVDYRLTSSQTYKLDVKATTERRNITNICAFLYGSTEQDRWVILSNHYDAWTNGAVDPNSGTVIMLEMARVLMDTVNATHWTPRRTLYVCSSEFVEEFEKILADRAVAVINMDEGVTGNVTIEPTGTPGLLRPLIDAAKLIPNPNQLEVAAGRPTVYDSWRWFYPERLALPGLHPPIMGFAGSGSDQYSFMSYADVEAQEKEVLRLLHQLAGVPVVAYDYRCAPGCYYLYHSMYEVPWTVENMFDPGFRAHKAVGQLSLELARYLSDELVIPFDLRSYGNVIVKGLQQLNTTLVTAYHLDRSIKNYQKIINQLFASAERLEIETSDFQDHVDSANVGYTSVELRRVEQLNRRLTQFERVFINPRGIYPQRADHRHVIFAAGDRNSYSGRLFTAVRETARNLAEALSSGKAEDAEKWLRKNRLCISELQYSIESAIHSLEIP